MIHSTSGLKLSRLLLKTSSGKLSWCKRQYLHSLYQNLLLAKKTSAVDPDQFFKEALQDHISSNTPVHDEITIQPDIPTAVWNTINEVKNDKTPLLKFIKSKTNLEKKPHDDLGQPTPFTHPHLFDSEAEATPGIQHREYALRRHRLMRVLSQTTYGRGFNQHVVLLSANSLKSMSNDIPYPFHQDVDFLYLSGVNEPDALLALEYNKTKDRMRFILFVKPTDPKRILWDGPVIGQSAARAYFKADESYPISEFQRVIKERYSNGKYCVWYKSNDKENTQNQSKILDMIKSESFHKAGNHPIEYNLQLLRLIKSDAEARILKKSASISAEAFTMVMRNTSVGLPESHLHALLEFECKKRGAQYLSFPPVVAGGAHANTLHYINNSDLLSDNDMVLMDGGCEYNAYASDMTRTWPVNGKFTPPQRELYQIVLNVQRKCLEECKPGVSLDHLYRVMLFTLGEHLQEIGFIAKNETETNLMRIATQYCPHHVGHYLGMDTHDTPLIHRGLPLQAGMVFTLEPGIYIPKTANHVPEKYRGIGIRIEDDILLTNGGPYVLTAQLPKEIHDIESLLAVKEET